jgi:hypothetical protein
MLAILVVLLAMSATAGHAQTKSLDFELLTWPELKQASHKEKQPRSFSAAA